MLSSSDWTQMAADTTDLIDDNEVDIDIRRGNTTVDTQQVRIVRTGSMTQRLESGGGDESRGRVLIVGDTTLNIAPEDRVKDENGLLYRVIMVRPNRRAHIMAECEVIG